MRAPLRRRLILGLLALVTLVLVVTGALTLGLLRQFLVDQVDRELAQTAEQVARRPFGRLEGVGVDTLLVGVDADGAVTRTPVLVVAEGASQGSATLSAADIQAIAAVGPRPSNIRLSQLGRYRFVREDTPRGEAVVVGRPLAPVNETLGTMLLVQVTALAGALVALGGVGAWLIRRELRPLERVAATARRVTSLPLGRGDTRVVERVPVEASGSEVADVALAFNEMLDHVDTSLEARAATEERLRRFVADASHELRTPLASIRGYAELVRRVGATDVSQQARAVGRIESEATRMGVLVDDLLLLARLDQGRPLDRTPVDLTRLAADAAADAGAASSAHPVRLSLPAEPVLVLGDEHRLRQVLANLLANVHQHTPAGTAVEVLVAREGDRARLTVSDTGPGVPEALAPRVFERFVRADDSRSRASGGTGLGLSIVSAVVQALGGQVTLQSQPGRTEVTVLLPTAAPPGAGEGTDQVGTAS